MGGAATTYNAVFYALQSNGARRSAHVLVPWLAEHLRPLALNSVLDVGCGVGAWLAEFEAHGITDIVGVDGDHVGRSTLLIPSQCFVAHNLELPLHLERRFDLVMCVEVVEHLDSALEDQFVANLARHGDLVLFSGAVPGQGGSHHVNERWPSHWVRTFARHGLSVFDVVRPALWDDERVAPWYRQNILLFARGEPAERLAALSLPTFPVIDVVHPRTFTMKVNRQIIPTLARHGRLWTSGMATRGRNWAKHVRVNG